MDRSLEVAVSGTSFGLLVRAEDATCMDGSHYGRFCRRNGARLDVTQCEQWTGIILKVPSEVGAMTGRLVTGMLKDVEAASSRYTRGGPDDVG